MPDFYKSKSGSLTAGVNNTHIHSTVDPYREAEKYISSKFPSQNQFSAKNNLIFLILFPGLNYLYPAIKKIFPSSKVITVHLLEDFFLKTDVSCQLGDPVWSPGSGLNLKQFLYSHIQETEIRNIITVTWEPVIRAFPGPAREYSAIVEQVLTEYNANITTMSHFGRLHLKNIFRNASSLTKAVIPGIIEKPVVIAGSGPTLELSIPLLERYRGSFFLAALSSSCCLLKHYGIHPDLVVSTDPGYYASFHLDYVSGNNTCLSFPLTANTGRLSLNPVLLINQGSLLENLILGSLDIPFVPASSSGTVAGSALFLMSLLTQKPVIMTGIDLCSDDIKTHCSPHAFDSFYTRKTTRTAPYLESYYGRIVSTYDKRNELSPRCRISGPLASYSGWFSSTQINNNFYRLNPSPVAVNGLKNLDNDGAAMILKSFNCHADIPYDFKVREIAGKEQLEKLRSVLSCIINLFGAESSEYFASFRELTNKKSIFLEILFSYDTEGYMKLIEILNNGNNVLFTEHFREMTCNCLNFLKREFSLIQGITGNG